MPGQSYKAWIRFSNGNKDHMKPDASGDARGMAIKLLGVPGECLTRGTHNKYPPAEPGALGCEQLEAAG